MQNKESFTRWLPLVGLTFAVFVFNTSEFMPIGLLTDIAPTLISARLVPVCSSRCTPGWLL